MADVGTKAGGGCPPTPTSRAVFHNVAWISGNALNVASISAYSKTKVQLDRSAEAVVVTRTATCLVFVVPPTAMMAGSSRWQDAPSFESAMRWTFLRTASVCHLVSVWNDHVTGLWTEPVEYCKRYNMRLNWCVVWSGEKTEDVPFVDDDFFIDGRHKSTSTHCTWKKTSCFSFYTPIASTRSIIPLLDRHCPPQLHAHVHGAILFGDCSSTCTQTTCVRRRCEFSVPMTPGKKMEMTLLDKEMHCSCGTTKKLAHFLGVSSVHCSGICTATLDVVIWRNFACKQDGSCFLLRVMQLLRASIFTTQVPSSTCTQATYVGRCSFQKSANCSDSCGV